MSKPYYIYVTEDCVDQASLVVEKIKNAGHKGSAVVIIGKDADVVKLKQEINYLLDKDYKLFLVMLGYPPADSGLALQISLANKYNDSADSIEKLVRDLENSHVEAPSYYKWLIMAAVFIVSALIVVFIASKLGLGVFKYTGIK